MPSLTNVVKDVRALGTSAPVRAAYEASKRVNGHALLFRAVPGGYRSRPIPFGGNVPASTQARQRCLDDARLILDEGARVFGTRVATGVSASWAMDPLTERCWPEATPWWQIDIRTKSRLSDVKWVWEAARHRDLVVLGRAATLEPDGPWMDQLESMLIRWCRECRPEQGVNWYSSLELALRAISWNQVLHLVGDRLHHGLRAELDDQLVASARHILVELPYTLSSMKNNHLLGDGLGLVMLGTMFPDHPAAARWRRIGDRLILKQLDRHMSPDGSMIEDSLSYHRFVLEMFIVRTLIGDAPRPVTLAMEAAAEHLAVLGALETPVPQYGDWDEGRVLADSAPAGSVAGTAHLALQMSGRPTPLATWRTHDELAWYADPSTAQAAAPSSPTPTWANGQFNGAVRGPWRVWLKRDLTPSHQHADLSSVWIQHDGLWLLQDPGTGTYNGPLHVRDGFRTTAAHPVWRPDGADLLGPHRAFRWQRATVPAGHTHLDCPSASLLVVWHDGFDAGRCLRLVLVEEEGVTILDRLPAGPQQWEMTLPEGVAADLISGADGEEHVGSEAPFLGWTSDTYGDWRPAPWRRVRTESGWTVWGAGRTRTLTHADQEHCLLDGVEVLTRDTDSSVYVDLVLNGTSHHLEVPRA